MRYFYSVLFYLAFPLVLLRLLWKSRKVAGYRFRIPERLGIFNFSTTLQNGIWLHAASVGETVAALPLIKALQKTYPTTPLIITTMTPTGSDRVKATFKNTPNIFHVYVPYDLPCIVKRFLKKVKPRLLIVMETELWPNILHYTRKQGIPRLLASARLSEKSVRRYPLCPSLIHEMLENLSTIAAQSTIEADRYHTLGGTLPHMKVVGNIKFDCALQPQTIEKGQQLRKQLGKDRPILIAASTHEGEEKIVLDAFKSIKAALPDVLLVIAPRHPDRTPAILSLCKTHQFKTSTRSLEERCTPQTDIYLANTLGELMAFYAVSDIAFVGGSLTPIGGHNPLEPALLALPILMGPYLSNCAHIAKLFEEENAFIIVKTAQEFAQHVIELFKNTDKRQQLGKRAKEIIDKNRGALAKHLEIIDGLLSPQ